MKSNQPDIYLIRKYLNGELDAKAMYKLERQAQDDPMLMDMIMGMEGDHQDADEVSLSEIDDLIRKRVQESKTVKIFAWKPWAAAASLIFAFMAAFWMFRSPQSPPAKQQMQVKQAAPAEQKNAPVENKAPAPVILPKTPLQHIQIAKSSVKTMKPELAKISAAIAAAPAPFDQVPAKVVVDSAAIARAAELNQYAGNATAKQLNEVVVVGYGVAKKKEVTSAVSTVKPALNTSPVALQGKTPGTMITGDQSMNEVVTVGYGIKRNNKSLQETVVTKNNIKASGEAQPAIGWKAYKKYLKENAVLGDGTKGTVVITFSVSTDGLPANLKIVKSLSGEADKMAVSLIYGGSRWIAGKDDPAEEITVKVKFH